MDYNPGIGSNPTPQLLYSAISDAGQSLGDGIREYRRRKDERDTNVAAAEAIGKAHAHDPEFLKAYADEFSKLPDMSGSKVKGFLGGLASWDYQKKAEQQQKLTDAQLAAYGDRAAGVAADKGFAEKLSGYMGGPAAEWQSLGAEAYGMPRPLGTRSVSEAVPLALKDYPGSPRGQGLLDDEIRNERATKAENLTPNYTQDPKTGARLVTYGRQILPTGYDPQSWSNTAEVLQDQDGNALGHVMRGPKGQPIFIKPPASTSLTDRDKLKALNAQLANTILPKEKAAISAKIDAILNGGEDTTQPSGSGAGGFGQTLWDKFNSGR